MVCLQALDRDSVTILLQIAFQAPRSEFGFDFPAIDIDVDRAGFSFFQIFVESGRYLDRYADVLFDDFALPVRGGRYDDHFWIFTQSSQQSG